jgi:hypothetical protein
LRIGAVRAQHFVKEREGGHSIDIVVSEKNNSLASVDCLQNSIDCVLHVRQQERIAEPCEPRSKKCADIFSTRQAFSHQEVRDARKIANVFPKICGFRRLIEWR